MKIGCCIGRVGWEVVTTSEIVVGVVIAGETCGRVGKPPLECVGREYIFGLNRIKFPGLVLGGDKQICFGLDSSSSPSDLRFWPTIQAKEKNLFIGEPQEFILTLVSKNRQHEFLNLTSHHPVKIGALLYRGIPCILL